MWRSMVIFCFLTTLGCTRIQSSSVATGPAANAYSGRVTVRATSIPDRAVQLGIVEAHGNVVEVDKVMPEFVNRVAKLGGNYGKVDDIRTKFELSTQSKTESYSCGTYKSPRTCTRSVTKTVEHATTTILGRAFLVEDRP